MREHQFEERPQSANMLDGEIGENATGCARCAISRRASALTDELIEESDVGE